jgi:hypothetical protein
MAGSHAITILVGGALTLLTQYVGSGFWAEPDVTPPPALQSFAAATGDAPGEVKVTVDFPANVSDYARVDVRWIAGATAPNAACTNGTVLVSHTPAFTDPSVTVHSATQSSYYSYRACIYDEAGNLTASNNVVNVQARKSCSGTLVGTYCWYKGPAYTSCDTVCSPNGGYNTATATYAGQAGTTSNCNNVTQAFGDGSAGVGNCTSTPAYGTNGGALGCCWSSANGGGRCTGSATTSTATGSNFNVRRYCACNY